MFKEKNQVCGCVDNINSRKDMDIKDIKELANLTLKPSKNDSPPYLKKIKITGHVCSDDTSQRS